MTNPLGLGSPAEPSLPPISRNFWGPTPREWALAALLFGITACTLTTLGAIFTVGTRTDLVTEFQPWLTPALIAAVWNQTELLAFGFPFALGSLAILLAHELGHFLAASRRGLGTSPPFFLPAPFGVGTFGAFLRIRTPIRCRKDLVAVAAAGPLAGAMVFLPILVLGIARSQPVRVEGLAPEEASNLLLTVPGHSLLSLGLVRMLHGPLPEGTLLNPDPLYLSGWLGMVATMLNLLPIGQLDGGHLLYAALGGRWHRRAGKVLTLSLLLGGWLWAGWWLWSIVSLLFGWKHPTLADEVSPLSIREKTQIVACALLFVVTFLPAPIRGYSLL